LHGKLPRRVATLKRLAHCKCERWKLDNEILAGSIRFHLRTAQFRKFAKPEKFNLPEPTDPVVFRSAHWPQSAFLVLLA